MVGADDAILDLGTKSGGHFDDTSGAVIGVDIEFEYPLKGENTTYIMADGRDLPFKADTFDFVVMNQVLEHVNEREKLISETARVLKPDGTAMFSFPNRFAFNDPHGLSRWISFLPKSIGGWIMHLVLNKNKYNYYKTGLFPLSPIGARKLINKNFDCIEYVTIDESSKSPEVYGDSLAARIFVYFLPFIQGLTAFSPLLWFIELIWPYTAYECKNHSKL